MKKNYLKKSLLVLSAAAMTLCPMSFQYGNALTANAAGSFVTGTSSSGDITFDESQIDVKAVPFGNTFNLDVCRMNTDGSFYGEAVSPFFHLVDDIFYFKVNISAPKLTLDDVKNISVTCGAHDTKSNSYVISRTIKPYQASKTRDGSYNLVYIVEHYQDCSKYLIDKFKFESKDYKGKFTVNSANYYSDDLSHILVTATCKNGTNGDNFVAKIRRSTATDDNIKAWAKRSCLLINALKEITGNSVGTLYMYLDDPKTVLANGNVNTAYKADYISFGAYTGYSVAASTTIINSIASGRNELTWVQLHEVSHCYCENSIRKNFGYVSDDVCTNVRHLSAIGNCTNLKNVNIVINDGDEKYGFKYNTFFDKKFPVYISNDSAMMMGKAMVNIANKTSWDRIETALSNNTASNSNWSYTNADNIHLAEIVRKKYGFNIPSQKYDEYYKFINSLRSIYVRCFRKNRVIDDEFTAFLDQYFGDVLMREFVDVQFIHYPM